MTDKPNQFWFKTKVGAINPEEVMHEPSQSVTPEMDDVKLVENVMQIIAKHQPGRTLRSYGLRDGAEEAIRFIRQHGRKESGGDGWRPIETAPRDGKEVLLYRPLANLSNDPVVTIRKTVPYNNHYWDATVPKARRKENYTDGSCYATHWQPLPSPPVTAPQDEV